VRSIVIVACVARVAYADGDDERHVLPCRPTLACTADLVAPGTLELEVGDQPRRGGGETTNTTPFLLKLPVAHWLELQVSGNGYTVVPGQQYFDNPVVGAKLHVIDQSGQLPSIAFTVSAGIPTQSPFELVATAHASKDYGKNHVDWNVGVAAWRSTAQPFTAIALTRPLSDRWSAAIEPHYFAYAEPYAPRDGGAMLAFEFAVKPWLVIDAAIDGTAIGQQAITGLAGVSIAPVRLWGGH
jgi:hypothetical protein